MRFKVLIVSLFFVGSLFTGISPAQNKVVVIPLDSGNCDCDAILTVSSAGQVWMDRNLGAVRVAQSIDDHRAYGWLYQWGRIGDGHEIPNSPVVSTLSPQDVPGHDDFIGVGTSPYDWRLGQNDGLWQGVSGTNNPCPAGFRLPTETEWETERASWSSNDAAGAFASPLKLVLAGYRSTGSGTYGDSGSHGYYWSSTLDDIDAVHLYFWRNGAEMPSEYRAHGFSVRCIKD